MQFSLEMIGVGSGLSAGLGNTNALLEWGNTNLLIDCGPATMQSLSADGRLGDIKNIYVTHLHSDHIGGLEMTGFYHYFMTKTKPNLYVPKPYVDRLWNALKAGMEYIYDPTTGASMQAGLQTYFNVLVFEEGPLEIDGLKIEVLVNEHVPYHPSYALFIDERVYWSSDTAVVIEGIRYNFNYIRIQSKIEAIFHDCQLYDAGGKANVHTPLSQLSLLIGENLKKKTWLMHYGNGYDQDPAQGHAKEFAGFVHPGQKFYF